MPRDIKEAIAVAVSKINSCPFCVDAHSAMLLAAGNKEVADKITGDRTTEIADGRMRAMVEWTLATRSPGSPALMNRPFSEQLAAEVIGTVVINNYINKMMDVLLNQSFIPRNRPIKNALLKAGAIYLSATVRRSKKAGEALRFLPEASLPDNLRWAEPNPTIRRAFACLAAAVNEAGERVLDEKTRDAIRGYLAAWDGKDPGMSRSWADQASAKLTGSSQIAAKLALLTAVAPYQVDQELVQTFRSAYPEDTQLLHVLSWSSFAAACTIGTWCSQRGGT